MKKDDYTVKTSALEAILVILACVFVFCSLVFLVLFPYIGGHMDKALTETESEEKTSKTELASYRSNSDVIPFEVQL